MPLGDKNKKLELWTWVVEKCEKRLTRWKSRYLSLEGRLTLIRFVLDGLPYYMIILFPISKSTEKKIEENQQIKRFFSLARKQKEEKL